MARHLAAMAEPLRRPLFPRDLGQRLITLFPDPAEQDGDRQRLAAFLVFRTRFTLITGGPGTGKTTTLARILTLLLGGVEADAGAHRPRIVLSAPTGKAALRVAEALRAAKAAPNPEGTMQGTTETATLHRVLGIRLETGTLRHGPDNPIDADWVIVDEASMMDARLMAGLLQALAPQTHLILLGDHRQLASVEAGAVLGDLCRVGDLDAFSPDVRSEYVACTGFPIRDATLRWTGRPGLGDCVVLLRHSRRFPAESPVARLSRAVETARNAADAERAWTILTSERPTPPARKHSSESRHTLVFYHPAPNSLRDSHGRPVRALRETILEGYRDYLNAESSEDALAALRRFCILTPLRYGPYGVERLNRLVEEILSLKHITTAPERLGLRYVLTPQTDCYPRQPILITRNDYSLRLFNGDVGVIEKGQQGTMACFLHEQGTYVRLPVALLPPHETAFALTVHKAQGSEFDRVLLLLPPTPSPVMTRELMYTAITRARCRLDIVCSREVFCAAVQRETLRTSGLADRLRALTSPRR